MTRLRLATADTFRSLRIRGFRLFFTGQLISQIGNWLTLIAQALLVLELTDSGVALGLLAAAQFGPVLVFGGYAGLIADRIDKRRLLLVVQALAMVQSFVLATLAFQDHPPVWAIYVVAAFGGLATAFDNPARRSFVVELVPKDQITNAVSLNSALMTGSRVIGPALGGLLVATVGVRLGLRPRRAHLPRGALGPLAHRPRARCAGPPSPHAGGARCGPASATPGACPSCGCPS